MWRCEDTSSMQLPDVARFLDVLNSTNSFFELRTPLILARAPGRLDVMGGIADYSGALVLELPLALATLVAVQPTDEPLVTILSTAASEFGSTTHVSLPLEQLRNIDYAEAHHLLTENPTQAWAAYVAGVLIALQQECGLVLQQGVHILIHCEVPIGKGISSSAALEVATMQALCKLYNIQLSGRDLALLCQKVENSIVGAPCGIMDQMTVACGEQDSLLALLCQPAELQNHVTLPNAITFWGIDSGIRHAVTGNDYGAVRVGAFMGYRIIADLAGLAITSQPTENVAIADPQWHGYLANIAPSLWETIYRDQLPLTLSGAEFLERYGGTTDSVTRIVPERNYAVRQPTAHPIYEHHRVRLFRSLLQAQPLDEEHLLLLGELMYQSHASYSACGLGSHGTDRLVELVREAGPSAGLYGAKITGGGSGGTVAVLARREAKAAVERIVTRYEQETGLSVALIGGSTPGAVAWGTTQVVAVK